MNARAVLTLAMGVAAIAWAAPLIRIAEPAPALAIAALRLTLAAPPMVLWASRRDVRRMRIDAREWCWLLLAGVALAGHFAFWVASVQRTTILSSVVLVTMQPLFVALGAWMLLRERVTRPVACGIAIASTGALLLVVQGDGTDGSTRGDLYALIGGVLSGTYLVIGRRMRRSLPLSVYGATVYTVSAIALLLAVLITRTPLTGHPPTAYLAIALLAAVPQLIGHNAINWALGSLPAAIVAVTILGEPLGAAAIGALVLAEVPSWREAAAGAVVLTGVAVTVWYGRPAQSTGLRARPPE